MLGQYVSVALSDWEEKVLAALYLCGLHEEARRVLANDEGSFSAAAQQLGEMPATWIIEICREELALCD